MSYRLWVSEGGNILVRIWSDGRAEMSTREHPDAIWKAPLRLIEEDVPVRTQAQIADGMESDRQAAGDGLNPNR